MRRIFITWCIVALLGVSNSIAQVSITTDGSEADVSAMLDIKSTTRGLLVPRLTTAQRLAIPSPAEGLLVYDTDYQSYWFFRNEHWAEIGSGEGHWSRTGSNTWLKNTTDNLGIGTNNPAAKLHVAGSTSIFGIGEGSIPTPTTIRGPAAAGSNIPGADFTIEASTGTGSAGSGSIIFKTAAGPSSYVIRDAVSSAKSVNMNPVQQFTFSHTVGSNPNRLLIVGISTCCNPVFVTNVTYGGYNLTLVNTATSGTTRTEMWYLINPPTGTANVVISLSSPAQIVAGASSWYNVNQTTPLGPSVSATGVGSPATVTVASSLFELVHDVVASRENGHTAYADQTEQWNLLSGSWFGVTGSASTKMGNTNVTMSWDQHPYSDDWQIVAVSIKYASILSNMPGYAHERMRITSTGNIGIGIANPTNLLHLKSNANPLRLEGLQESNQNTFLVVDENGVIKKRSGSSGNSWLLSGNTISETDFIGSHNEQPLRLVTNLEERMRITPNGNIGIGTTMPNSKLHIESINQTGLKNIINLEYTSNYNYLQGETTIVHDNTPGNYLYNGIVGKYIEVQSTGNHRNQFIDVLDVRATVTEADYLNGLYVSPLLTSYSVGQTKNINWFSGITNWAAVLPSGNSTYNITNACGINNGLYLGGTQDVTVNVGSAYAQKNFIRFDGWAGGIINVGNAYRLFLEEITGRGYQVQNYYGLYIDPVTQGTQKNYSIYAFGGENYAANYFGSKTGIGEENPTHMLHVKASANPLRLEGLQESSETTALVIDANGVVTKHNNGVGFNWALTGNAGTNPGTHFIGTTDNKALFVKVNNSTSGFLSADVSNTLWGYQALKEGTLNTFGNTILGYRAAMNSLGSNNIAIGFEAMQNGGGIRNIVIGHQAGNLLTFGDNNIIIGHEANVTHPGGTGQLSIGNLIFAINMYSPGSGVSSGSVGIGTRNPSPAVRLHVKNINVNTDPLMLEGLRTSTQNNILVVDAYGTVTKRTFNGLGWGLIGNTLTGTEFLGSTNNQPVRLVTNNTERIRITPQGNIGIGTPEPATNLHVYHSSDFPAVRIESGPEATSLESGRLELAFNEGDTKIGFRIKVVDDELHFKGTNFSSQTENTSHVLIRNNGKLRVKEDHSMKSSTYMDFSVNGSISAAIETITSNRVITSATSESTLLCDASNGNIQITINETSYQRGRILTLKKIDSSANTVTIDPETTISIDGALTYTLSSQWKYVTIQCDGSNWFVIGGN